MIKKRTKQLWSLASWAENQRVKLSRKPRGRTESLEGAQKRFWSKVRKTKKCWIWEGTIGPNGYGFFAWNYRRFPAHRISYEICKGEIPNGLCLDHLCRNRACVNPDHLEAVTMKVNVLRGVGPTAILARKTHCKRGHPLSGDNLRLKRYYTNKGGIKRQCMRCHLDFAKTPHYLAHRRKYHHNVWKLKIKERLKS